MMSGKRFASESNFLLKKCDASCNGDIISKLPDDLIVKILSFLRLKEAAATSILSSRWSGLWKYTPCIHIKELNTRHRYLGRDGPSPHIGWVNTALELHESLSLTEFRLSLYIEKQDQSWVARLLEFAFSRRTEKLELDLQIYSWKRAPFLGEILGESRLSSGDFRYLRELHLKHIKLDVEGLRLLLHDCVSLERLILDHISLPTEIDVVSGVLKQLVIKARIRLNHIKVSCPNLTWFCADFPSDKLSFGDVPKLVAADFVFWPNDTIPHFASAFTQLQALTISFPHPKGEFLVPEMPKLKKVLMRSLSVDIKFPLRVARLLKASPCLEEFILEIDRHTRKAYVEAENMEICQHRNLRVFKIIKFDYLIANHRQLLSYILDSCVMLEKIIIHPIIHPFRRFSEEQKAKCRKIEHFSEEQRAEKRRKIEHFSEEEQRAEKRRKIEHFSEEQRAEKRRKIENFSEEEQRAEKRRKIENFSEEEQRAEKRRKIEHFSEEEQRSEKRRKIELFLQPRIPAHIELLLL